MTSSNNTHNSTRISKLLNVLNSNYDYLLRINGDPAILRDYKSLLDHLKKTPAQRFNEILNKKSPHNSSNRFDLSLLDSDLEKKSLEQIKAITSDPQTKRKQLEQIAETRFSLTKSALRSIANAKLLREKILTCIDNEFAHEAIVRVAEGAESVLHNMNAGETQSRSESAVALTEKGSTEQIFISDSTTTNEQKE